MPGGILNILATGNQNICLTGNPADNIKAGILPPDTPQYFMLDKS